MLTWRLGTLRSEGRATTAQISLAKHNNVHLALTVAREARQLLSGMGITNEYPIMHHMVNLESVVTYEGTHDIHLLIIGHDVTGIAAFKQGRGRSLYWAVGAWPRDGCWPKGMSQAKEAEMLRS